MVSLAGLEYAEMGRCLLASLTAGLAVWGVLLGAEFAALHLGGGHYGLHGRIASLALLVAGVAGWAVVVYQALERMGSSLPRVTLQRLGWSR